RPSRFQDETWGCRLSLEFLIAKLLDFRADLDALERNVNPFAPVVLAHLKALETSKDPASRYVWKVRLLRGLYNRGWSAEDVSSLFRLVDWLMVLPPELQEQARSELYRFEEERRMPYLSSFERVAMSKGHETGRAEEARRLVLLLGARRLGEAGPHVA